MSSSQVVITWNLGHIDSVATTIGWAWWLGEGENQVFPTHFSVQPYYSSIAQKYIKTAVQFHGLLAAPHQTFTIHG